MEILFFYTTLFEKTGRVVSCMVDLQAIPDQADCIFDGLQVGMRNWNVHMQCESVLQLQIKSANYG